jgi:hypothetical protein
MERSGKFLMKLTLSLALALYQDYTANPKTDSKLGKVGR